MTQSPDHPAPDGYDNEEDGNNPFLQQAEHAVPLPRSWWVRWPVLAVIVALLGVVAGIGHIMGGLAEFGKWRKEKSWPDQISVDARPTPPAAALTMALSKSETSSLDGYKVNETIHLPQDLESGPLLAGGARTRLIFQANSLHAVEISRVTVEVKAVHKEIDLASFYTVDPTHQPGYGAARPRTFHISFDGNARGDAFYINAQGEPEETNLTNLLAAKEFSLLRLDNANGLQETLDVNLIPRMPGLYQIKFHAYYVSDGHNGEETTGPIYVARK